jgi:predicted regulator of Ras-like GTPase activity (Roadblock/LC7/MglB family)
MEQALQELLARMRAENDLDLAAVCADGLLVGADSAEHLDAQTISMAAGDIYLLKSALGAEIDRGLPKMAMVEYDGATVVVSSLDHGAELVLVTRAESNLGRLRIAARRFHEQYHAAGAVAV